MTIRYSRCALPVSVLMLAGGLYGCDPGNDVANQADQASAPSRDTTEMPARADADTGERDTTVAGTVPDGENMLFAEATISPTEGNDVRGTVNFRAETDAIRIVGQLTGLEEGKHGLHVHEKGDCSAPDASTAGGHFAPDADPHGAPSAEVGQHHVGDLGNVEVDEEGTATFDVSDPEMSLSGENSVVGRALIVHAGADDFESQPSGDAGDRVGCGVIRETTDAGATRQSGGQS